MMKQRVPLVGSTNTRFAKDSAISTASGVVGVGVVGVMIVGKGRSPTDKDQKFVNCFPMTLTNPLTGKVTAYVIKRPGFASYSTPAAGEVGTALHVWAGNGNKIMSAFGATNSTLYDGLTSKGAITGKATAITETVITTTPTLVISSNDNTAWYHDTTTATKITDAQFPGNAGKTLAGTFAHMDGYAFILDTEGTLWNSDLNTVTSWTAMGFIKTNVSPDIGVACIKHRSTIVAFGSQSMEVFRNAGNATGSPLSRIEEATQQIGLLSANALGSVNDVLAWVGTSRTGDIGVYLYDGGTPQRVSNPFIENQISLLGSTNIRLQTARFYGRSFVIIMGANSTYVYAIEDKAWHEWSSNSILWTSIDGQAIGSGVLTYALSSIGTAGKVYVINPADLSFQDNGNAFTATIRTSLIDHDTGALKVCASVEVICDTETSGDMTIQWTDDDYQNYSTARTVSMSAGRRKLNRCGSYRRRAYVLSHSENTPMRVEALEMDIS